MSPSDSASPQQQQQQQQPQSTVQEDGAWRRELRSVWISHLTILYSSIHPPPEDTTTTTTIMLNWTADRDTAKMLDIWKEQSKKWLVQNRRNDTARIQTQKQQDNDNDDDSLDRILQDVIQEAHHVVALQNQQPQKDPIANMNKTKNPTTNKPTTAVSLLSSSSLFGSSMSFFVWSVEQEAAQAKAEAAAAGEESRFNSSWSSSLYLLRALSTKVQFMDDLVEDWTEIAAFVRDQLVQSVTDQHDSQAQERFALARNLHQEWYGKLKQQQQEPSSVQQSLGGRMDLMAHVLAATQAAAAQVEPTNHNTVANIHSPTTATTILSDLVRLWWTMWIDYWSTLPFVSLASCKTCPNRQQLLAKAWTCIVQPLLQQQTGSLSAATSFTGQSFQSAVWHQDPIGLWFRAWIPHSGISSTPHSSITRGSFVTTSEPDDQMAWLLSQLVVSAIGPPPPDSDNTANNNDHLATTVPLPRDIRAMVLWTQWLLVTRSSQFPWHMAPAHGPPTSPTSTDKNHSIRLVFVERLLQLLQQQPWGTQRSTNELHTLWWQVLESVLNHAKYCDTDDESKSATSNVASYQALQSKLEQYYRHKEKDSHLFPMEWPRVLIQSHVPPPTPDQSNENDPNNNQTFSTNA